MLAARFRYLGSHQSPASLSRRCTSAVHFGNRYAENSHQRDCNFPSCHGSGWEGVIANVGAEGRGSEERKGGPTSMKTIDRRLRRLDAYFAPAEPRPQHLTIWVTTLQHRAGLEYAFYEPRACPGRVSSCLFHRREIGWPHLHFIDVVVAIDLPKRRR